MAPCRCATLLFLGARRCAPSSLGSPFGEPRSNDDNGALDVQSLVIVEPEALVLQAESHEYQWSVDVAAGPRAD